MTIDFNNIPEKEEAAFKGGELSAYIKKVDDGVNRIMEIRLVKGASIGLHKHEDSSEIIYILKGNASVTTNGVEEELCAGMASYCKKGWEHTVKNKKDEELVFFAVVPMQ